MLILPPSERDRLVRWVEEGWPSEVCGLLVGRRGPDPARGAGGGRTSVARAEWARNSVVERAHDRYELDPSDFLRVDERARAEGLEIVGIWHSHPDHPARPSETDRKAAWEGWSYLIVSVGREGVRELRSWRLEEGTFREESLGNAPSADPRVILEEDPRR